MTAIPTMSGAVRATEVIDLERTFALEQCMSPDCTHVATWDFTTLPCQCVAPLCDECFKITRRRYERARQRTHPFADIYHPRCGTHFKGHKFSFTYTRI